MKSKSSSDNVTVRVLKPDSGAAGSPGDQSSRLAPAVGGDHSSRLAPDQPGRKPATKLEFSPVRGPAGGRGGRNTSTGRGTNKRSSVQTITGKFYIRVNCSVEMRSLYG